MSRPEKDDADKRKLRSYYATDAQYRRIEKLADKAGLSISMYVLSRALSGKPKPPKP